MNKNKSNNWVIKTSCWTKIRITDMHTSVVWSMEKLTVTESGSVVLHRGQLGPRMYTVDV